MAKRAVPILAVLGSFLLLLAACDTGEPSGAEYLTEEIPPCVPVPGSSVDPCEPDVPVLTGGGQVNLGNSPWGMRTFLDEGGRSKVYVAHLVLRGTYRPGTVRCIDHGIRFRPPPYTNVSEWPASTSSISIKCYVDVRVNSYVLGTGPANLTVQVYSGEYWFEEEEKDFVEAVRNAFERALIEGRELLKIRVPEGGIEGREMMLFVGPSVDVSAETWEVHFTWDVQQREDGTAIAVHPHRDYWSSTYSYPSYQSRLEMELPAFTQAVAAADQARITEYGGRTAADEGYPMLVTDANRLSQFMTDIGAYNHPEGPPVQQPAPCGLAVPEQADNPGLMRDCQALLAAKDMLRGTGSLNWGTGTTIASWDGITTSSDPSGVTKLLLSDEDLSGTIPPELGDLSELTHLDMSSNSLTGEIPRELSKLSNLESIKLSGNSLTGCIPTALKSVATNDLSSLNLLHCPPAPNATTAATPGETSVPLSWTAVADTGTYRVEYKRALAYHWTVDDDTLTGTTHTVDGLNCKGEYRFGVSAYGDGTTYAAAWSDPSVVVSVKTGACVYPEFGASSYSFKVIGDAAPATSVGTVSATNAGGGSLEYEILAGNEDGLFAIGDSSGEITVAAGLTGRTGTTVTLTVVAWNVRGGGRKATVEVAITE